MKNFKQNKYEEIRKEKQAPHLYQGKAIIQKHIQKKKREQKQVPRTVQLGSFYLSQKNIHKEKIHINNC